MTCHLFFFTTIELGSFVFLIKHEYEFIVANGYKQIFEKGYVQ
jgi:hypothetical protein